MAMFFPKEDYISNQDLKVFKIAFKLYSISYFSPDPFNLKSSQIHVSTIKCGLLEDVDFECIILITDFL